MTDSPNPFALDADIAAMCDEAQAWLMFAAFQAGMLGARVADYLGSFLPRLATGYRGKAHRTEDAARAFANDLRAPSRKPDRWDRQAARNAKWTS